MQQLVQQVGADLVHPLDILQHQQQGALLRRQRQDHQHAVEGHDAVDEHVGLFLHAALSAAEHGEQGADGLAIGGGDGDVLLADVAGDGQHHRLPGVEILLLLGLKAGGGDDLGVGHGPVGQKVGQQVGLAHPGLPQQDEGLPPPPGAGAGEELEQALQLLLPAHQKVVAALVLRVGPGVPLLHDGVVQGRGLFQGRDAQPVGHGLVQAAIDQGRPVIVPPGPIQLHQGDGHRLAQGLLLEIALPKALGVRLAAIGQGGLGRRVQLEEILVPQGGAGLLQPLVIFKAARDGEGGEKAAHVVLQTSAGQKVVHVQPEGHVRVQGQAVPAHGADQLHRGGLFLS